MYYNIYHNIVQYYNIIKITIIFTNNNSSSTEFWGQYFCLPRPCFRAFQDARGTFLTSASFRCTGLFSQRHVLVVEINGDVNLFSIVANDFVLHLVLRFPPLRINHLGPVVQNPITVNSRLVNTSLLRTATRSAAKINCRRLTEINSRFTNSRY